MTEYQGDQDTLSERATISNLANDDLILVTGATGYVGGRLVGRLLEQGYRVRVFVRDPSRLQGRTWVDLVEVVQGDVLRPQTLPAAMEGVSSAYYLIHSMSSSAEFHERDLRAARNFAEAAQNASVNRIIYLGGLGDPGANLSDHLRSRQETGRVLREAGVPVTEFRAAIIVGSGSLSFEMIRYLTERVPVMICPRWVFSRVQPIAIRDVLAYLVAALGNPDSVGQVIGIGGTDVMTYADMMRGYAEARDLSRWLIAVPVLTPRLSSYWVHWVTPVPASIAQPLIEGLHNDTIVRSTKAKQLFPNIEPLDYQSAVSLALRHLDAGEVETSWSDALFSSQRDVKPVSLTTREGIIIERRQKLVDAPANVVYQEFARLGGQRGWLYFDWAWRLRGILDRLVGGVGFRRGRRDPEEVRVGDALDFWRVEAVETGRLLRLRAEMKVPGRAWLEFEANPEPTSGQKTRLTQTAFFAPKGLAGLLYWYILYPIHSLIFSGLIDRLQDRANTS
ncbi:MAG: SDR family oxidoreductase [Candidatus Promineifilaceae bacterium]|nr:SDR family oxidoreductase [Candidatus Promineifilaceae bacterium]